MVVAVSCYHVVDLLQQTTEPSFPEMLLIAINKQGVNLIDPVSKVSDGPLFDLLATLVISIVWYLSLVK